MMHAYFFHNGTQAKNELSMSPEEEAMFSAVLSAQHVKAARKDTMAVMDIIEVIVIFLMIMVGVS